MDLLRDENFTRDENFKITWSAARNCKIIPESILNELSKVYDNSSEMTVEILLKMICGAAYDVHVSNALICHAYRLFDDPLWYHFIPFNRKYRPEILTSFKLITVTCGCCGKPGEVTQEQIDNAIDGKISCPVCGIYSNYSVHDK